MPTWDDLRRPVADHDPARETKDVDQYAELCAAVFSTGTGQDLMAMMRARYVERRAPPGASEAILREAEAVRGFIFELERARDRGLKTAAAAKAKST